MAKHLLPFTEVSVKCAVSKSFRQLHLGIISLAAKVVPKSLQTWAVSRMRAAPVRTRVSPPQKNPVHVICSAMSGGPLISIR